jgi:hypothetical protein
MRKVVSAVGVVMQNAKRRNTMPIDNRINNMVIELYQARLQKAEAEKLEKAILEALKPLVDPKFDALPNTPIVATGIELSRSSGESRTIKGDLLLERGVSPDVVFYATVTTKYFRYLTSKPKAKK